MNTFIKERSLCVHVVLSTLTYGKEQNLSQLKVRRTVLFFCEIYSFTHCEMLEIKLAHHSPTEQHVPLSVFALKKPVNDASH